jgi:hypothetical protein
VEKFASGSGTMVRSLPDESQAIARSSDPAAERGMRTSKARAGHRTGKVCHRRWSAYGKSQGYGRRNGSPRSSTISASNSSGWHSSLSSEMLRRVLVSDRAVLILCLEFDRAFCEVDAQQVWQEKITAKQPDVVRLRAQLHARHIRFRTSLSSRAIAVGKRNFRARDKAANNPPLAKGRGCRDRRCAQNHANSGLFSRSLEISGRARLRGGAGRTRTCSRSVMESSGPRPRE